MQAELIHTPTLNASALPRRLLRDLRSDHAGESGAVSFYRGILCLSRDPKIQEFAAAHLETERKHLETLESQLPPEWHCRSSILWHFSGWMLGLIASAGSRRFTFATVAAVEQFVIGHYDAQIKQANSPLKDLLVALRHDEKTHLDDAAQHLADTNLRTNRIHRIWTRTIQTGSALAVSVARFI